MFCRTVLLYMTDIPEGAGGETVFSEAWPAGLPESERKSLPDAISELRASGDAAAAGIENGSWEEELVARCRSRLAVRPTHGRAVLFYSQHPNGAPDKSSKHGGCPVLSDSPKWAANLWVWNLYVLYPVEKRLQIDLLLSTTLMFLAAAFVLNLTT